MKKTTTLFFLLYSLFSFGQKALMGSVLVQDLGQSFQNSSISDDLRLERKFEVSRVPSFAGAYLRFGDTGQYTQWQLAGWRFEKIADLETAHLDSIGLSAPTRGGDLLLASGRLGFAKGWPLNPKSRKLHIYLEAALNAGWQYAEHQPKTSQEFPQTYFGTTTQLGPNLVLQKNWKQGFFRVSLLTPLLRFSTQYNQVQNPLFTSSQNTQKSAGLDLEVWKRTGLEVGAGCFIGK